MKIKELYEQVRDGRIISDIELQREIIYDNDKQRLVINSIVNDIPLPAFYLWKNNTGILEVLDGKQRIEAIKKFMENNLQYENKLWMQTDILIQEKVNNSELSVIICEGEEELRREIFKRINTLGIPLSSYEVLNGLYNGEYLRGLTAYISQDRDAIKVLGSNLRGKNQYKILNLLITFKNETNINDYVKLNQNSSFANDQRLITKYIKFVSDIFKEYSQLNIYFHLATKYIKDIAIWKVHKDEINARIKRYLKSDDAKLTNKSKEIEDIINTIVHGISVDDKRLFSRDDKLKLISNLASENGKYRCAICNKLFYSDELTMDHIDPWSKGGRTVLSNAQLLCRPCNSKKSNNI